MRVRSGAGVASSASRKLLRIRNNLILDGRLAWTHTIPKYPMQHFRHRYSMLLQTISNRTRRNKMPLSSNWMQRSWPIPQRIAVDKV